MSHTVCVLKYMLKKKKKKIQPHTHMDPDKNPGVYDGAAEYQKNYYI